jgi:hypothetical protein
MDICNEAIAGVQQFCWSKRTDTSALVLEPNVDQRTELCVSMIEIDHMRDKRHYIKTIERWNKVLNITGSVIFYGKLKIFLILFGCEKNLKDFQQQLKTHNIDVDSRGRPCKEKLSKVLCCEYLETYFNENLYHRQTLSETKQFALQLFEAKDKAALKKQFCDMSLEFLYTKYIDCS